MKRIKQISCAIIISLLAISCSYNQQGNTYYLYYMGGQSNMEGFGYVSELPEEYNRAFEQIPIFCGTTGLDGDSIGAGKGVWDSLRPGYGVGFYSDGVLNYYSRRVGAELSFGSEIARLNPDRKIAIIKYARGGSSLSDKSKWGTWNPDNMGVNQYDHFLTTLNNAFASSDIDGDGVADTLIPAGIIWMQGESDAVFEQSAIDYEYNLTQLMGLMREALGDEKLPIVIGKIADSVKEGDGKYLPYDSIVHKAQECFTAKDTLATLVTNNDNYSFTDEWHYITSDYIDLGKAFATEIDKYTK